MKKRSAFFILRVSLGAVFLVFGIGKFRGDVWAQTIKSMPFFQGLPWSTDLSVLFIGTAEVITGISLILGLFTRFFAALAALQLTAILILLNFQETRDFGLLGAALYMLLVRDSSWSVTGLFGRKRPSEI